jgi:hypothetical protein
MLIKIKTQFTLDPSSPFGRKNLNLLLTAAGLRSQIEVQSMEKIGNKWHVTLFLERPEFWGEDLKFLKDDILSMVVYHKDRAEPATELVIFEHIGINTDTDRN